MLIRESYDQTEPMLESKFLKERRGLTANLSLKGPNSAHPGVTKARAPQNQKVRPRRASKVIRTLSSLQGLKLTGTAGVSPAGASRYGLVRPQVLSRRRAAGGTPAVPVESLSGAGT